METEILDPKTIAAAATSIIVITNTTGVFDDSNNTTPIFKINPTQQTPWAGSHSTHGDETNDGENEDYADDNEKVEEVEPLEEYITDPILIERNEKDSDE